MRGVISVIVIVSVVRVWSDEAIVFFFLVFVYVFGFHAVSVSVCVVGVCFSAPNRNRISDRRRWEAVVVASRALAFR